MKVKEFGFEFSYKDKKSIAACQSFKVPGHHKYPMYRVVVPRRKGIDDVFIFYEVNFEKKRFFWYKLEGIKEEIAKSIASGLTRYTTINKK